MKVAISALLLAVSCSAQMKSAGGFKHNGGMSLSPTASSSVFFATDFEGAANCSVGGLSFNTASIGTGVIDSTFAHGGTKSCKLSYVVPAGVNTTDQASELKYNFTTPDPLFTAGGVYEDWWIATDAATNTALQTDGSNQVKLQLHRALDGGGNPFGGWTMWVTGKVASTTSGGGYVLDDQNGTNVSNFDGVSTLGTLTWHHMCQYLYRSAGVGYYSFSLDGTVVANAYPNVGPSSSIYIEHFRLGMPYIETGAAFPGATLNFWVDDINAQTTQPSGCGFPFVPDTANMTFVTGQVTELGAGAAASTSVGFTNFVAGGSAVVVDITLADTTTSVSTVTDTAGNAYTLRQGPTSSTARRLFQYVACGAYGGFKTVTSTFSGAIGSSIVVHEYTGPALTGCVDQTNSASGNNSAPTTANVTTTQNTEILHGYVLNDSGGTACSVGAAYTERSNVPGGSFARSSEDRKVVATGTYNALWGTCTTGTWAAGIVTLK